LSHHKWQSHPLAHHQQLQLGATDEPSRDECVTAGDKPEAL